MPPPPADTGEHAARAHAELLARARAGDRQALRGVLSALLPRVRNLVRYLVRGDDDVEDIVQDALVTIVRRLGTYRAEGPLEAWVDRLVARATFAELRRRGQRRRVEPAVGEASGASSGPTQDEYLLRRRVVAALDRLPEPQRHALVLHHVLEMNVREIGEELGVSAETVRSRLRLARAKLRTFGFVADPVEGRGEREP
ncbi:MAG TPA: RNA polymerase sigma factor [Polyangiaceae bacterium]|jgi:RNA polymerase sigma-70 factor (ECF subfamily)|nr:RNA polymerase sigma factor [Polyangiaceae bacterium]